MPTESTAESAPERSYIEAISEALRDEMREDESVFLLGQDIAAYGGAFKATAGFLEEFGPERVLNTPIAESGTIGIATGAAALGRRPVVEMQFADFISCGFNQLVNVTAKMFYRTRVAVPLVVRLPAGAGVGAGPFHSQSMEAWFLHVPGLKVVAPSNPADAYRLLREAIRDPNPVLYFEHKFLYRRAKGALDRSRVGTRVRAEAHLRREGRDLTVVSYGWMAQRSLEAAEVLAAEGIDVEVIDLPVLSPLDDRPILRSVEKTAKVAIVHEASRTAGFGAELSARIAEHAVDTLDGPIRRIAFPDTPVPFHRKLEAHGLPAPERIAAELRELHRW